MSIARARVGRSFTKVLPTIRLAVCAIAVSMGGVARADECRSPILNPCINSDTLWVHPGASAFVAIRGTDTAKAGQVGFGMVMALQSRPVSLRVFSPGPPGTDQSVIDNQLTAHFLWHYGITDRLEMNIALPVTLSQNGAGLSPITAGPGLPSVALRDARFGVGFSLLKRRQNPGGSGRLPGDDDSRGLAVGFKRWNDGFGLALRFDVSAPSANADAFAGEPGAVLAPAIVSDYRFGRFLVSSEVALRLRKTTEFLGARVGSQAFVGIGAGFDILTHGALSVTAEARMLPGFASQADVTLLGGRYQSQPNGSSAAPAEWTVGLRTGAMLGGDLSFQLGGGGAIPLSQEAAFGNPRFRFTFGIRYAPLGRDSDADGVDDKFDKCPDVPGTRAPDRATDGCRASATSKRPLL
jgi:OmpA-OmpF porin, OOP family